MSLTDDDKQWFSEQLNALAERREKYRRENSAQTAADLHAKLDHILKSGDQLAITAITTMIRAFQELIEMEKAGKK